MKKTFTYIIIFLIIIFTLYGFVFSITKSINRDNSFDGKTRIIFWHAMGGPLGKVLNEMINEFNSTHTNIVIVPQSMGNYNALSQKLLASIVANNQPDIAQAYEAWIAKFVDADLLVPFDNFIENLENYKKDFYDILIKDNTYNGKLYSLPFNKSTPVLYYNKDLFKEAGLNPDNPPKTWDDFIYYSKKITKMNKNILGYVGAATVSDFECLLVQNGGSLLSKDLKRIAFNSIYGVESLKFLLDLKFLHKAADFYIGAGFQFQTDFITKRAAMMFGSSVSRLFISDKLTFNWGMAPLLRKKKNGILIYGTNIVLFKKASKEKQKAAWEFIDWFTNPVNQAKWSVKTGYLPSRKSSLKTKYLKEAIKKNPDIAKIINNMQYGFIDPRNEIWFSARQYLKQAISNIFLSKKINDAYKEYENRVKENPSKQKEYFNELNKILNKEIKKELDKAAKDTQKWMIKT